jgi:uncharacterized protein (TIGR03437 family)
MDAAYNKFKKFALLFATALLVAAPSFAATAVQLTPNPSSVSLTNDQAVPVTVTASAAASPFTVTAGGDTSYFLVENVSSTTNTSVSFTVRLTSSSCGALAACNAGKVTVAGGGASVDIPVIYGGTSGGTGTGTITVASPITMTVSSGGTLSRDVSVTSTSSNLVSYSISNPTTNDGHNWLGVTASPGYTTQVSATLPSYLRVTVSPGSLPNATYYGSFMLTPNGGTATTVQVVMNVGLGGGTSGSYSPSTTAVSFAYPTGTQTTTITFGNTSAVNYTATYSSSNGWLSGPSSGQLASGLTFYVTSNASLLGTGNYTGYVSLNDGSTITVNLSVNGASNTNFSPSSLSFTGTLGSSPQSATVTVSNVTSINIPSTCSWVGVTYTTNLNQYQVTVYPTDVASAAVYTCSISFGTPGSLPVTMNLSGSSTGGGGTTTGATVAPSQLSFAYSTNSGDTPPFQYISVGGTGTYALTTSNTGGGANFISASGTGQAPGLVGVTTIGGLTPGTYQGSVSILTSSGTQTVGVTLVVSSGAVVQATPGSINFNWQPGNASDSRTVQLVSSDGSPISVSATSSASWVTISNLSSTTTPATFTVTSNPSGLANGLNAASITVTTTGAANGTVIIPVVANVSNSTGSTGNLTLSQSSLTFNAVLNGAQPATQTLTVSTSTTGTAFTASVPTSGCSWLTISPSGSLSTNQNITVTASQTGLGAATYSCNLTLVSGGATQTVPVSLVVSTSGTGGGSGSISVNPTSLSFTYLYGSNDVPGLKGIVVSSASGSAGVGFSSTVTSGNTWLSVTPASAMTQQTLSVMVSPTSLAAGTYNGNIRITPNGATYVDVPVTLTVQSLTVTASPATLTFNYRAGDSAPQSQTVAVDGGAGLTFSASASSTGNWLVVTPNTGTTPANLTVSVDPTNLTSAGQQTGTITVLGTGTSTSTVTITVTINVTAPLPTINGVTNGASFATASSISAGEIITIFGTNIGPATPAGLTLDSNGNVSTTLGGVQVLVGGYPSPMIYVSGTQISAVVPYDIASPVFRPFPSVQVKYLGQTSNGIQMTQVTSAPGLFTLNSSGSGPGAILNSNNSVNSSGNPANKGDIVVLYMTGEGQTNPAGVTGKVTTVNPAGKPLTPQPVLPLAVLIDGQPANVTFYGEAPGFVSGVMQVNVQIPAGARSGNLPVSVQVGSNISQTGVTVSVK